MRSTCFLFDFFYWNSAVGTWGFCLRRIQPWAPEDSAREGFSLARESCSRRIQPCVPGDSARKEFCRGCLRILLAKNAGDDDGAGDDADNDDDSDGADDGADDGEKD